MHVIDIYKKKKKLAPNVSSADLKKPWLSIAITFLYWSMCMCAKFLKSCPTLCDLWTVAHQAPLSMGFSRQEHWSGLPCLPPGDLPNPGTEPSSPASPALVGGFFTTSASWEDLLKYSWHVILVSGVQHYHSTLIHTVKLSPR